MPRRLAPTLLLPAAVALSLAGCGAPRTAPEAASAAAPLDDNAALVATPAASPDSADRPWWHARLGDAIAAGKADGRPAVLVVSDEDDTHAVDVRRWILDDPAALDALAGTHPAIGWSVDASLERLELPPGILCVLPDGRTRRYALPATRAEVVATLTLARQGVEPPKDDPWLQDLLPLVPKAQRDESARSSLAVAVEAQLAGPILPARAQALAWLVREADEPALRALLMERLAEVRPAHRGVADAAVDLGDDAWVAGDHAAARRLYAIARAHAAGSPTMTAAVDVAEALAEASSSPARQAWERRRVLDVVVIAPDAATATALIARWRHDAFFPVLLADDRLAARFIAAFRPAHVVIAPSTGGMAPDAVGMRAALLASWSGEAGSADDAALRARLSALGIAPEGVVVADPAAPEALAGLALAAGRFQGLAIVPTPGGVDDRLDRAASREWAARVEAQLAAWPGAGRPWRTITLAGRYPFRWTGPNNWGTDYSVDDLIGRDDDGIRRAVCGRLVGDEARALYQAMGSLFLQPRTALAYDTYEQAPRTTFGRYRMAGLPDAWRGRIATDLITREPIAAFRARTAPWRAHEALVITSSGGPFDWSAPGDGGTAEDAPVGAAAIVHVTHSNSAALPYDDDSIAGRMLWGGVWYYYGSMAEPFLNAFQPASHAAPRIAAGIPFATAYRMRSGQFGWRPWRLQALGDPQACLRREPMRREPASVEVLALGSDGSTVVDPLRRARLAADPVALDAALAALDPATLDARALTLALDACLERGALDRAHELWSRAPEASRADADAKRCARIAAGALLDRALLGSDFAIVRDRLRDVMATAPRLNWVERWLRRIGAQAERQGAIETWRALVSDLRADAGREHADAIDVWLAGGELDRVLTAERWGAKERETFIDVLARVAASRSVADLAQAIDRASLAVARFGGDVPAMQAAVRARAGDGSLLHQALAELEARRRYHRDWLILGPFRADGEGAPELERLAARIEPDRRWPDGEASLAWRRPFGPGDAGYVDLLPLCRPNEHVHAYAAAMVVAERECQGFLLLGSDDGVTAWLGGAEVHRNRTSRGLTPDQDRVPVRLRPGRQWLLLRIDQHDGGWGFSARFAADQAGTKPLEGVRIECPQLP